MTHLQKFAASSRIQEEEATGHKCGLGTYYMEDGTRHYILGKPTQAFPISDFFTAPAID